MFEQSQVGICVIGDEIAPYVYAKFFVLTGHTPGQTVGMHTREHFDDIRALRNPA